MNNTNGDLLDAGLQAVMGKDRCQDVTVGVANESKTTAKKPAKKQIRKDEPADASWAQVTATTSMDKVKVCAKWALLFGSVSGLLFYWQMAGLLDPKAAVPSLILCALGAGLTVGYHAR